MNYRTTRIYSRSLELIDLVARVVPALPPGYGFLADQLRRAAASVPLNFLEGCGRRGAADRRRFFTIATGSANEVAATLDVMCRFLVRLHIPPISGTLHERSRYPSLISPLHSWAYL